MIPIVVNAKVVHNQVDFPMKVEEDSFVLSAKLATPIDINRNIPVYEGPYTVTASSEPQIVETNGLLMRGNITVNPVPSNYGLITWNGNNLTVS